MNVIHTTHIWMFMLSIFGVFIASRNASDIGMDQPFFWTFRIIDNVAQRVVAL
jgi:hypothetical protein